MFTNTCRFLAQPHVTCNIYQQLSLRQTDDIAAESKFTSTSYTGSFWRFFVDATSPAQTQRSSYQPSEASRFREPPQSQHSRRQGAHVNVVLREKVYDTSEE
ncbi:hypothetical protein F511_25138 [Dorcoceras hygrometricum]|uniref:Uncharacterized protein n=1 Tax=Dorcoceras hygrometricum TaxID=472368 RepID=A0A2Z7BRS7_9LAMI|nr:hypothetical protein F511_25138 [Dorcoceras hygrometricum]